MEEKVKLHTVLRSTAALLFVPVILATSFSFPRPARADIGLIISLIILATATSVTIDATTCYFNQIWACSNSGPDGSVTAIALPPVPVTIEAEPNPIDRGQSSTLTWNGTNATSCQAAGNGAWLPTGSPASGNTSVSPLESESYQVVCSNSAGSNPSNIVTVEVRQPTVVINATPERVVASDTGNGGAQTGGGSGSGGTTVVSWDATNVNACTITKNGIVWQTLTANSSRIVSGSASTPITSQTTFVINCTNNASENAVATSATKIVNLVNAFQEF